MVPFYVRSQLILLQVCTDVQVAVYRLVSDSIQMFPSVLNAIAWLEVHHRCSGKGSIRTVTLFITVASDSTESKMQSYRYGGGSVGLKTHCQRRKSLIVKLQIRARFLILPSASHQVT